MPVILLFGIYGGVMTQRRRGSGGVLCAVRLHRALPAVT